MAKLKDHIDLVVSGELPQPPIASLLGFRIVEAEAGRAVVESTRTRIMRAPWERCTAAFFATLPTLQC